MSEPTKQIIVIRKDLNMGRGKEIAQGSHASMAFITRALSYQKGVALHSKDLCTSITGRLTEAETKWLQSSFRKITCQVDTLLELMELCDRAHEAGISTHIVEDSGRTVFNGVKTVTCAAFGPDYDDVMDPVFQHLKLY
jgi:PTH2 family peptidyl-tRNA hydrolase